MKFSSSIPYRVGCLEDELGLENLGQTEGTYRYRENLRTSDFCDTKVGLSLLNRSVLKFADRLDTYRTQTPMGPLSLVSSDLLNLVPSSLDSAFIATRVFLNAAFDAPKKYNSVATCNLAGALIVDHINYLRFKQEHPEEYLRAMREAAYKSQSQIHRVRMLKVIEGKHLRDPVVTTLEQRVHLGRILLVLFIETTGLIQEHEMFGSRGRRKKILVPTKVTSDYIAKRHASLELMAPIYYPMVVPPVPWTSWDSGGFHRHQPSFIRSSRWANQLAQEGGAGDLSRKFAGANYLGSTAWRINRSLLAILEEAWGNQLELGGLPKQGSVELMLPPKPWGDSDSEFRRFKHQHPEVVKQWKQEASEVYRELLGAPVRSKRITILRQLHVARKVVPYEAIYFPHNIDFRGRYYPLPTWVNPQGDDIGKALLEFSEELPVDDYWDRVNGASLYGFDKATFDQRKEWTAAHQHEILSSAADPFSNTFWADADSPWLFLAWALQFKQRMIDGKSTSRFPVWSDGTCNGVQHLALAGRDLSGCSSVNLVAGNTRNDLYAEVATIASGLIPIDSPWYGLVNRKVAKRNSMTLAYGVTKYGMKEQLDAELPDILKDSLPEHHRKLTRELANYIDKALGMRLGTAKELMSWYHLVAKAMLDKKWWVNWVTPDGLHVVQDYRKTKVKKLEVRTGSHRIRLDIYQQQEGNEQDKRKNISAFAPNITHSLDASHLTMTMERLQQEGIRSFTGIHDSFGVHSCNVETLRRATLEALHCLYSEYDPIATLAGRVGIPELAKGTYNIDEVLGATYAFG